MMQVAQRALADVIPVLSPMTSRVSDAAQEDIEDLTEKDPEAIVSSHTRVDLQFGVGG